MSGLAHYLEEEGLSTVIISLIRVHTETMNPPRALWVPFELGRPFGLPGDPAFQHKVMAAALELFAAPSGPVIADFPLDAPPPGPEELEGWACPVDFGSVVVELDETQRLKDSLLAEIAQLSTWYDLAHKERGRTTMGASGLEPAVIAEFLSAFLDGGWPQSPREDIEVPWMVKLASEDLKAYYLEAATAKPGAPKFSAPLNEWFWGSTTAAKLFLRLQKLFADSEDENMRLLGGLLMIPAAQAHRKL